MKQIWPKEEDKKPLVFWNVKNSQLFIDCNGWLCGKKSEFSYVHISDEYGFPRFGSVAVEGNKKHEIKEILPEITKLGIVDLSDD